MAETCKDNKCPTHGTLKLHGRLFTGTVMSAKGQRTAVVEFERRAFLPKYERYERRRTKLKVHNPVCLDAKEGDIVQVQECRPISKYKSFVIVKQIGKEELFAERTALREEAKVKQEKAEKPKQVEVAKA